MKCLNRLGPHCSGQSFGPGTSWEQVLLSRFHPWLFFCLQPTTVNLSDASDLTDAPPREMVIILQACPVIIYCKSNSQFYIRLKKTFKSKRFISLPDN